MEVFVLPDVYTQTLWDNVNHYGAHALLKMLNVFVRAFFWT